MTLEEVQNDISYLSALGHVSDNINVWAENATADDPYLPAVAHVLEEWAQWGPMNAEMAVYALSDVANVLEGTS
jgi:hypothetical protein